MSLKIDRVQLEIVIQQDQARQKMIELEERMRSANRELQKTKNNSVKLRKNISSRLMFSSSCNRNTITSMKKLG